MYLCIDVGGTKTLIAALDEKGNVLEEDKILTSQDYKDFLKQVEKVISSFKTKGYKAAAVGVPAVRIDRVNKKALSFGNLPWNNVSIGQDVQKIANCEVYIENDAKLAGLSEAIEVKDKYKKVLYITVSTGIGYAVIDNLEIDVNAGDAGGRLILFERGGKHVPWESFASGKAILEIYGEMAKDINDEATWRKICKDLAEGMIELIAIFQPDAVIIGGGVGLHFDKYGKILKNELDRYNLPFISMPDIIQAKRPTEAVIYGCYDYVKQQLNDG